jgi:hypothetical protein
MLLEAEVAPGGMARFQRRYGDATGQMVQPGNPVHYQRQRNKWGTELRVYFNDHGMAIALMAAGVNVEYSRRGYRSGEYRYRFNNNKLWWALVESHGLRLGAN